MPKAKVSKSRLESMLEKAKKVSQDININKEPSDNKDNAHSSTKFSSGYLHIPEHRDRIITTEKPVPYNVTYASTNGSFRFF